MRMTTAQRVASAPIVVIPLVPLEMPMISDRDDFTISVRVRVLPTLARVQSTRNHMKRCGITHAVMNALPQSSKSNPHWLLPPSAKISNFFVIG